MAKYSLGQNNAVENVFSDNMGEVSTFSSVGDRKNDLSNYISRRK
jgi:hypothetical protein